MDSTLLPTRAAPSKFCWSLCWVSQKESVDCRGLRVKDWWVKHFQREVSGLGKSDHSANAAGAWLAVRLQLQLTCHAESTGEDGMSYRFFNNYSFQQLLIA